MDGKKTGGKGDLDRGIDGVIDLDCGLLRRLCVCLHRRRRRRVQGARVMKERVSDAPDPGVATAGKSDSFGADDVLSGDQRQCTTAGTRRCSSCSRCCTQKRLTRPPSGPSST